MKWLIPLAAFGLIVSFALRGPVHAGASAGTPPATGTPGSNGPAAVTAYLYQAIDEPPGVATGAFVVTFTSTIPGQGEIYFGTSCAGLVELATEDSTPGTTSHTVTVTQNDLPGTVGDNGVLPGVTYYFETVTVTAAGSIVDNNGGACYKVTIPATIGPAPGQPTAVPTAPPATATVTTTAVATTTATGTPVATPTSGTATAGTATATPTTTALFLTRRSRGGLAASDRLPFAE
ncbi:MAG TPA: hypothetical protein VFB58_07130 [Chloroflexota bacterium]|nr:hypothetical protein [Chloroflexota bacterium]